MAFPPCFSYRVLMPTFDATGCHLILPCHNMSLTIFYKTHYKLQIRQLSAVSSTDGMVDTQLCKLRATPVLFVLCLVPDIFIDECVSQLSQ